MRARSSTTPQRAERSTGPRPLDEHDGGRRSFDVEQADDALIRCALRGEAPAFEQLMRRYERLVFKVAVSFTRERESALDIVQNVFLKAFRGLDRLQAGSNFRAWLMRIATNESINWTRRHGRHQGHAPVEAMAEVIAGEDDPAADYRRQEEQARLLDALEGLRPRYRQALSLRYFQGLQLREIAELLDCSENVVKQLLFRGVRALRDAVHEAAREPTTPVREPRMTR